MMWEALFISLKLATVTTAILLVIAMPLAYLLAFGHFRGRTMLETIVALPLVLPPTVLGYFVLLLIAPDTWIGESWQAWFDSTLAFSFSGMVTASILYSLPFAVQPMQHALLAIPKNWLEMAHTQQLNLWQRASRVILPAAKGGVLAAVALAFAHTMGEFGVVLMVGGSIPGETKVASIALFELVEMQQDSRANQLALVLLSVSFAVLTVVYAVNRRGLAVGVRP